MKLLRELWRGLARLALATVILLALGCENGGSDEPAHDFGDNNPGLYIAVGDSITAGVGTSGYPALLSPLVGATVQNRGVYGETSRQGQGTAGRALDANPGYLLILYGANDVLFGRDTDMIANNLRNMVRAAIANQTIPAIATLTPMVGPKRGFDSAARRLSERIRALAAEEGARLVDLEAAFNFDTTLMQADGLHPNADGDALIAAQFANAL